MRRGMRRNSGTIEPPVMNHRGSPQQQNQLRRKETSPTQVVAVEGSGTQASAYQKTGDHQGPGSLFIVTGLNAATLELPQAHNGNGEKEPEFQSIVNGQEDRVGGIPLELGLESDADLLANKNRPGTAAKRDFDKGISAAGTTQAGKIGQ